MTLYRTLLANWDQQLRDGFLLGNPSGTDDREAFSEALGVSFRHRYLPHRAHRGDPDYLKAKGIMGEGNARYLFADSRDERRRPCFLCPANIATIFPREVLIDASSKNLRAVAGANFAWISPGQHYTVVSEQHRDQTYSEAVLDYMVYLHDATAREFRVLFNGPDAGASIPWHLHFQISTERMPIENLARDKEELYPTVVRSFAISSEGVRDANLFATEWLSSENTAINLVVADRIFVFPRDRRKPGSPRTVGAFELAGLIVEDEPLGSISEGRAHDLLASVRP